MLNRFHKIVTDYGIYSFGTLDPVRKIKKYTGASFSFLLSIVVVSGVLFSIGLFADKNPSEERDINQSGAYGPIENLEVLEDPAREITFEKILSKDYEKDFFSLSDRNNTFGFTDSHYWARFLVQNHTEKPAHYILEIGYPLLDHIVLFRKNQYTGEVQKILTGYSHPYRSREIDHRNFLFHIDLSPGTREQYYIKFYGEDRVELPIRLWERDDFQVQEGKYQALIWIYYGSLFAMILFNGIIYFSFREKTHLEYVAFLFLFGFWQATQNGLVYQYLLPESLDSFQHYIHYLTALLALMGLRFTATYLRTHSRSPVFHRFLKYQRYGIAGLFLVFPFLEYSQGILVSVFIAIVASISMIALSVQQSLDGHHSARVFLFSWIPFLIGSLVYAFRVLGFLPASTFTTFAIQYGSAFQMIILSIGIVDRIHRMRKDREQAQQDSIDQLKRSEQQMEKFLFTLAATIEARDHYTGGHVERVAWYSRELSLLAGMDQDYAQRIYLGAIVHDLGKIAIPDEILNKNGQLTDLERSLMQTHTEKGHEVLTKIGTDSVASNIARYHHERWDGEGYPRGLKEGDIPLEARIVAIADFWDAITTERSYHDAMNLDDSTSLLLRMRGQAFDPDLVDLFLLEEPGIFQKFLRKESEVVEAETA